MVPCLMGGEGGWTLLLLTRWLKSPHSDQQSHREVEDPGSGALSLLQLRFGPGVWLAGRGEQVGELPIRFNIDPIIS